MTNKKNKQILLPLLVCCVLSALGCASAPVQQMSDARQAILAASQLGGEQRAPQQMLAARTTLTQAETALRNRQFKQARAAAEQARELAIAIQKQINQGP